MPFKIEMQDQEKKNLQINYAPEFRETSLKGFIEENDSEKKIDN